MGKLIVLEGIDASGKTSISRMLYCRLAAEGKRCMLLSKKNPKMEGAEESQYVEKLRNIVWAEKTKGIPWGFLNETQWILQLSLWYSVLTEQYIKPLKEKEDILLVDGWFYKIYARCQLNKNVPYTLLDEMLKSLDVADEVYLLDNEPEECWERRTDFKDTEVAPYGEKIRNYRESFVGYQGKVQNNLHKIAEGHGWDIINCRKKKEKIIVEDIHKRMGALV